MIWSRPDLIDSLTWVCACLSIHHHIVCGLEVRITDIGSGPSMDGRQSTWRHLAPLVMATIVAPVDLLVRTNWRRFLTFAVAVVLVLITRSSSLTSRPKRQLTTHIRSSLPHFSYPPVSNVVEIDMDERKIAEAGIVG
ncbi:hypothetical protein Tsp_10482 [Trichinella spiralis]|uniref:Uncharacterized protein n=1 Tax=Trichinella spiralis TaxID=6334 RepID=E5SQK6_TRISP|nr:hypothetical protein Tsp_10482 [Trichinella spiralis]KRY34662.1 hypothetical protein T01_6743 [Trichinella spiralis]